MGLSRALGALMRPKKESTQRQQRSLAVEFVPRDFFLLMKFEFAWVHFTTATFLLQSPCVFSGAAGGSSAPIYHTGCSRNTPPEPPEARPNTLRRGLFSHSREGANARHLRQGCRRFDRFFRLDQKKSVGEVARWFGPPSRSQARQQKEAKRRRIKKTCFSERGSNP